MIYIFMIIIFFVFSTNPKGIGILYLSFASGAGFLYLMLSVFKNKKSLLLFFIFIFITSLVGSNTFIPKIYKSINSVLLPIAGSYISSRTYVFFNKSDRQILYNKVFWTPSFYTNDTQKKINELVDSFDRQDNSSIYENTWSLMVQSDDPEYGRSMTLTNMLCNEYNKLAVIPVTEFDFYEHHQIPYEISTLMGGSGTQSSDFFQNTRESLALTLVNTYSSNYQVGRNVHNNYPNTLNLGFQNNNDFIVTIMFDPITNKTKTCYIDCKHQSKESIFLILQKIYGKDFSAEIVPSSKFIFGCNIYMIGNSEENIILSSKQKESMLNFLFFIAKENPSYFLNFFDSEEFVEFEKTGNVSVFKKSSYPVPKLISSREDLKKLKPIVEYTSVYDRIKESVVENKNIIPNSNIDFDDIA